MQIEEFRGSYEYMNNFYPCTIEFRGLTFKCAEAAYQAQKCKNEEDKVRFTEYPGWKAHVEGRKVDIVDNWNDIKIPTMQEVIFAKFTQDDWCKKRLMQLQPGTLIINGNSKGDMFWGMDAKTKEGPNHLGMCIMRVMLTFLEAGLHDDINTPYPKYIG